ncbi:MAG: hypothetical protein K2H41_06260, partial [Acetatifactor sp.]|nr:hypothetical protein [Acetatifactor sp.]
MFEQLNMTNKLKRQISKVVSIALCAAMLVTALPADLLGGVASVKAAPIATEELLDIGAAVTAGTLKVQDYTADVTVGNFKIHALNGMSEGDNPKNNQQVTIDANGKKIDGYNFTHRLKMNGAGQSTYRSIEFTTNGAAKVKVYGMSSSKNNVRHLTLIDSDDKVTTDSEGNDGNNISATEFSITSAGTYYISCDAAYNIYGVKVTPTTSTTPTVTDGDVSDGDVSDGDVSDGDPDPKPEELGTTDGLDPGSVGDRTWTFPVKAEDAYDQSAKTGVKYEGDAGNYRGLKVDAKTVSGAKFQVRGSDVLINAGTIVQVPVDGDCEITVVAYDAGYAEKYTVSLEETNTTGKVENVKTDGATRDFTYTGAKGYVNIVPTAQTYLKSIAVKHTAAENPGDEKPDADGFYNGFNAKNAVKGRSYVFDFTDKENLGSDAFAADEKTLVDISKGLFAYKKAGSGSYYHTPKYGVEFQSPSTLTFDVAGNSYIVVGGDDNSNATLTASTTSGEVSPETLSSKTAGHAELADCKAQGENTLVYKYTGGEGQVTLTVDALENGSAGKAYIAYVCVIPKLTVTLDSTKPDVWDFGAMEVKGANNLLTVDAINGLYPEGTKAGATGVTISTFEAKDSNDVVAIKFVTGGKNHRIRTTNTAITRFDAKSLKGANDTVYNGYFYSNNESNLDKVANSLNGTEAGTTNQADHLDIYLYEGDTLTCLLGSNGNTALYKLYNPDNEEYAEFGYTATYGVEAAVFHAADEGWYKLYCTNEKLVCARITREHAPKVAVSGSIDVTKAEGIPDGYGVIYTNVETGYKTAMTVADGKYTGTVSGGYSYKVSLKDANGYVVRGGKDLAVGTDKETIEHNLTVETVVQKTITGKVKGLTEAELAKVKFVFEVPAEYVFEPQITLTGDSYTLKVEDGVTYK